MSGETNLWRRGTGISSEKKTILELSYLSVVTYNNALIVPICS